MEKSEVDRPSDTRHQVEVNCPGRVVKFVAHSGLVLKLASRRGWLTGARYTNLRDVRRHGPLGFLDVDWKHYDFDRHIEAARATRPLMTVARDIEHRSQLETVLKQARALAKHASFVVVVPKDPSLAGRLDRAIPPQYLLGYSVPTRYGATSIPVEAFGGRPVHLLGGRPDTQRALADRMNVVSIDGNRFTLDACFGDFFDGVRFRPHPQGGYKRCLSASLKHIDSLWASYKVSRPLGVKHE